MQSRRLGEDGLEKVGVQSKRTKKVTQNKVGDGWVGVIVSVLG